MGLPAFAAGRGVITLPFDLVFETGGISVLAAVALTGEIEAVRGAVSRFGALTLAALTVGAEDRAWIWEGALVLEVFAMVVAGPDTCRPPAA